MAAPSSVLYNDHVARVYAEKTKGLRIATRCVTVEQFIETFHRTCDDHSFFISTLATRPVGLETAFTVDLAGGQPVLRGIGRVLASWKTTANPFKRPGVQIGVRRLTEDSERVFERLLLARVGDDDPTKPVLQRMIIASPQEPPAAAIIEARAPGSDDVLPANPLAELTDDALEDLVDTSLHEFEPRTLWSRIKALCAI
jgi:hypothetical protein